ncbi:MAG TPA: hypothetical protein VE664_06865 [Actinomycetes bacterium]|nr:hypothetical protein [Actinomycetes bacterium]
MDTTGRYTSRLRRFYGGRKLILTGAPLAMLRGTGRMVRSLGAERPFLLAAGVGTGPLPTGEEGEWHVLRVSARDIVSETRAIMSLLANLPAPALAALDRYDPHREALVLSPPANELRTIAGRRVYAPRRPSWRRLEDKTLIDQLWDAHGIRRPPSRVVPADGEALRAAARRMDRGLGTVWSGDTREGVNGGAVHIRWVRDGRDAAEATAFLSTHCDRARVVPFIEGVPCSIHGLVLADGVVALRPVEMVTLRAAGSNRLVFAGAATFWDPPEADRDAMRRVAAVVGAALRDRVGYLGAFTVDGVLSEDGFLPTELNTRYGAGLTVMADGHQDLPLWLLNLAVVEGEPLGVGSAVLEADVLERVDRHRSGAVWTVTHKAPATSRQRPVAFSPGGARFAAPGEQPAGTLWVGPSNVGGYVRLALDPARIPVGPSVAPLAVDAFALADERLATSIGPMSPARPVR